MNSTLFVGTAIYIAINVGSCICAILTFTYIVLLRLVYPECVNRVSLKLQTAIAFFDVIRHLINICSYNTQFLCGLLGFLSSFCQHINTFLNVAIALNLQIVYIHEKIPKDYFKSLLYLVPFIAALLIDLIPFAYDGYSFDVTSRCSAHNNNIFIVQVYIAHYPGLLYCFIIPICIMVKLAFTKATPDPTSDEEAKNMLGVQDSSSRKIVSRVSLYPLTSFLCHLGQIIACSYWLLTNKMSNFLTICDLIGTSMVGTVNMVCFIYDPYILFSFYHIKNSLINRGNDSKNTALVNSSSQEESSSTVTDRREYTNNEPIKPHKDDVYNPVTKRYVSPIPIPGARDPEEIRREVWHTTDLHLHPKYFFKTNF